MDDWNRLKSLNIQDLSSPDRTKPGDIWSPGNTAMDQGGFNRDQRGRWMVPQGWQPFPGFTGTVITPDGIEITY